jgi:hypothetical protein
MSYADPDITLSDGEGRRECSPSRLIAMRGSGRSAAYRRACIYQGVRLPVLPERQRAVRATVFDHANFSAGIRRRANIRQPSTQRRG